MKEITKKQYNKAKGILPEGEYIITNHGKPEFVVKISSPNVATIQIKEQKVKNVATSEEDARWERDCAIRAAKPPEGSDKITIVNTPQEIASKLAEIVKRKINAGGLTEVNEYAERVGFVPSWKGLVRV